MVKGESVKLKIEHAILNVKIKQIKYSSQHDGKRVGNVKTFMLNIVVLVKDDVKTVAIS